MRTSLSLKCFCGWCGPTAGQCSIIITQTVLSRSQDNHQTHVLGRHPAQNNTSQLTIKGVWAGCQLSRITYTARAHKWVMAWCLHFKTNYGQSARIRWRRSVCGSTSQIKSHRKAGNGYKRGLKCQKLNSVITAAVKWGAVMNFTYAEMDWKL